MTERAVWSTEQLHELIEQNQRADHLLQTERDRRYEERFIASQKALESAFLAAEKAFSAALASAEHAVAKAEAASERRFQGVNEFRQTLSDQAGTFIARLEVDARLNSTNDRIGVLAESIAKVELQQRTNAASAVRREEINAINESVTKLRDNQTSQAGRQAGAASVAAIAAAVLALIISLVGVMRAPQTILPLAVAHDPPASSSATVAPQR